MWLRILIPGQKNPLRLADISRCSLVKDIKEKIKDSQRKRIDNFDLIFSGKLLNDTFSLFDYGVNVNDPLQLITIPSTGEHNTSTSCEPCAKVSKIDSSIFGAKPNDCTERQQSANYKIGDIVDVREVLLGAWFEAQIKNIVLIQSFNNDLPLGSESLSDADFYFKIKYLDEPDSDELTITSTNMRFRSAIRIDIDQLELNKKYLVNYNIDRPELRGHWYDGQITSIKLLKEREEPGENDYEIKATIFLMEHESPIKDCTLKIQEFFEIESKTRNPGLNDSPENCRIYKPDCDDCLDAGGKCKSCNCSVCGLADNPDLQIICDECGVIFHLACLKPPLKELPADDWYCKQCKKDNNNNTDRVERKHKISSSRDWGKGMACVSRSTVCTSVPSNHFGKIPGIPVGSTWKYRIQVSEVGIHRPHVAGISGRENEGSFSLVLSGGYEDDIDRGSEFVYTGSGGRDLSGNKRCNVQSMDQVLTKQNGALARNCNPDFNKSLMKNKQFESKNWKSGLPVRVVRSYKLAKVSKYAPAEGFRYDGIYKIVKYWPEKGKSGFIIWRYLIRRDDPEPAPWTKEGKKYIKDLGLTIEYPPGYCDTNEESQGSSKSKVFDSSHPTAASYRVTNKLLNKIKKDEYNSKTWKNLLSEQYANRKEFTDAVSKFFTCICCLNILNDPVTLASCSHNICNNCLLESISCGIHKCPVCRMDINADTSNKEITFEINNTLKDILSDVFNDS